MKRIIAATTKSIKMITNSGRRVVVNIAIIIAT